MQARSKRARALPGLPVARARACLFMNTIALTRTHNCHLEGFFNLQSDLREADAARAGNARLPASNNQTRARGTCKSGQEVKVDHGTCGRWAPLFARCFIVLAV